MRQQGHISLIDGVTAFRDPQAVAGQGLSVAAGGHVMSLAAGPRGPKSSACAPLSSEVRPVPAPGYGHGVRRVDRA
jgi:hypothetical protein